MSAACLAALLVVALLLAFGLPWAGLRARPPAEWETAYPRLFPALVADLGIGLLAAIAGLWPVYGVWSIALVFLMSIGSLMMLTLLA